MSRHVRAQTTPTHASGFHLFTVAMTGHAKDNDTQASPNNVQQYDACMKHGNMSVLG